MLSNLNRVGKHYYENGISKADSTGGADDTDFRDQSLRDYPTSPVVVTNEQEHDHLD